MELVRELRPDGVIVDVGLPDGTDGIELTRKLRQEFPSLTVLILSAHDEPEYIRRAAKAGAMGYVLKDTSIENLRLALRRAFNGRRTFNTDPLGEED
jgi:DNA-binding NarL/FixJ family response regulator